MITINNSLDQKHLKKQYVVDDRVRIENIFSPSSATKTHHSLNTSSAFDYAYIKDGRPALSSPADLTALSAQQQHNVRKSILELGSQGVGYLYGRHPIDAHSDDILIAVKKWLNDKKTLELVKYLTGKTDIKLASAQATRFSHGHFLTRHQDVHELEQRRLAYVLNFSENWHPDWGGLLQFYEKNGTPRDAWSPLFNSMAIFDVRHIHSVTYVAPLAAKPRLSITGWFRAS
jgi:Rps23 Pro-64 3,4-dihydroxylase Tpa1-like proline 4-hydroxylase